MGQLLLTGCSHSCRTLQTSPTTSSSSSTPRSSTGRKSPTISSTYEGHTAGPAPLRVGAISIILLSLGNLLRGITHFVRACLRKGSEVQTGTGDAALEAAITAGACGAR
ncbi:hypothetical protein K525DRAFT_275737 [Schizophyllum commune Loenen D]|nr:hypothetical protein K525DRAFT_275737 [Schizophyllum commune Loenen D]